MNGFSSQWLLNVIALLPYFSIILDFIWRHTRLCVCDKCRDMWWVCVSNWIVERQTWSSANSLKFELKNFDATWDDCEICWHAGCCVGCWHRAACTSASCIWHFLISAFVYAEITLHRLLVVARHSTFAPALSDILQTGWKTISVFHLWLTFPFFRLHFQCYIWQIGHIF